MAETSNDAVKVTDGTEKEVSSTNIANGTIAGEEENKSNGTEAVAEAATANDEKDQDGGKENEASDKDSDKSTSEHKRKHPPVTAHERYDRKRSRGGSNNNNKSGTSQYNRTNKIAKNRFEDQPESSDAHEIRRQVEFYFSNSNLPIDAFLLKLTGGHRNNPVPLKVIHDFKRMRHFQPYSAVRDAVKQSSVLDLNDNDEVTRKIPLSETFTDDPNYNRKLVHTASMSRSIYVKGFGEENKNTHLDIEAFFAPYGPISSVRLRRKDDGLFKGSVFVEFESEENQQRFLALDPKPQWVDGEDLQIMSKQEYVDMKHQGILDGTVKPKSPRHESSFSGRDSKSKDRRSSREWVDKDDWKNRRNRDQDRDRRSGRGRGRGRGGRGDRGGHGGRNRSPDRSNGKRKLNDDDDGGSDRDDGSPRRSEVNKKAKTEKEDAALSNAGVEAEKPGPVEGEAVNGGERKVTDVQESVEA